MSVTLQLTDEQIAELKALTHQDDVAAALRVAADEYIRYRKRLRLIELSGKVEMLDNWAELEQTELAELDDPNNQSSD